MRGDLFSFYEPLISADFPAQGTSDRVGELWNRDRVRFEQLPSLQDLLCACEHEALCKVLMEDFAGWGSPQGSAQMRAARAVRARMMAALEVVCSLEVPERSDDRVFLPREAFEFSESIGAVIRYVDVALIDLSKTARVKLAREELWSSANDYDSVVRAYDALSQYDLGIASSEFCSRVSWEEVLSTRVWMHGWLCGRERYLMLASAFWEMTRGALDDVEGLSFQGGARQSLPVDLGASLFADEEKRVFRDVVRRCAEEREAVDEDDPWPFDPYGLLDLDDFDRTYNAKLRSMVAVANHRAFMALLDGHLDVARRLGVAA